MHQVVNIYPITTPITAASISTVNHTDFSLSVDPKVSAQTGKKIETKTWKKPVIKRLTNRRVKLVVYVNSSIAAQLKTRAKASTDLVFHFA